MLLAGRVALVTGAARRLGKEIARQLAAEGCHLAIHYGSSADDAERTARELRELGVEAEPLQADLTRPREIEGLFEALDRRFGRLDLLVNSAAGFESAPFEEIDAEAWDRVHALNLRAPFLCLRHASGRMRASERPGGAPGAAVNIADLSGLDPWRGYAHHATSKAGLLHLTRLAARELAPDVRVNAVVPGPILPPPGVDEESESWRRTAERVPLGRSGESAEVGRAVAFLAGNDFVTGVALRVDGGEHLLGAAHH